MDAVAEVLLWQLGEIDECELEFTAADWLEDHGAPRVMLWSAEANPDAQRLFERLGFRRTMVEMTREPSAKTPRN